MPGELIEMGLLGGGFTPCNRKLEDRCDESLA